MPMEMLKQLLAGVLGHRDGRRELTPEIEARFRGLGKVMLGQNYYYLKHLDEPRNGNGAYSPEVDDTGGP